MDRPLTKSVSFAIQSPGFSPCPNEVNSSLLLRSQQPHLTDRPVTLSFVTPHVLDLIQSGTPVLYLTTVMSKVHTTLW